MPAKHNQSGRAHKKNMPSRQRLLPGLILALFCFMIVFVAGPANAAPNSARTDVVALVNNRPIYGKQLKAAYDLLHLGWGGVLSSSVSSLKRDYGEVMAELIVTELIAEELEKQHLEVTKKEMEKVEEEIRADYPGSSFEDSLIEEYIDLDTWRTQLRATLIREKFTREFLRPQVKIDHQEIENYYNAHIDEFNVPPTIRFLLVSGAGSDMVQKAMEAYLSGKSLTQIEARFPQVSVQELRINKEQLAATWGDNVEKLALKKPGPVLKRGNVYEAVILLERVPASVTPAVKAFLAIESALLEEKLDDVFKTWLEERLKNSSISVTAELSNYLGNQPENDQDAQQNEPQQPELLPAK